MPQVHHIDTAVEMRQQIQRRTGWRVSNLLIEICGRRVILRGQATTTHARQLAHQAMREMLPHARLENVIQVQDPAEVLTGMPLH
jgi:hypothetical protein